LAGKKLISTSFRPTRKSGSPKRRGHRPPGTNQCWRPGKSKGLLEEATGGERTPSPSNRKTCFRKKALFAGPQTGGTGHGAKPDGPGPGGGGTKKRGDTGRGALVPAKSPGKNRREKAAKGGSRGPRLAGELHTGEKKRAGKSIATYGTAKQTRGMGNQKGGPSGVGGTYGFGKKGNQQDLERMERKNINFRVWSWMENFISACPGAPKGDKPGDERCITSASFVLVQSLLSLLDGGLKGEKRRNDRSAWKVLPQDLYGVQGKGGS